MCGDRQTQDGVELVQWASTLPNANGRVGMVGLSYLATNQLFTAAAVAPDSPLDFWRTPRQGGTRARQLELCSTPPCRPVNTRAPRPLTIRAANSVATAAGNDLVPSTS